MSGVLAKKPDVTDESSKFAVIWHTLAAVFVAAVTSAVAEFVVGFLVTVANELFSNESEGLIRFSAAVTAGVAGVYCARAACDKLFSHYSKKFIFLFFAAFAAALLMTEIFAIQPHWGQIPLYAEIVAIFVTAFWFFWQNEPL